MINKSIHTNYRIFILLGLLLFAAATISSSSAASTIYVNNGTGNDNFDGISPIHTGGTVGPKATIQNGTNTVNSFGTVKVADGTYKEHITINQNLTLIGKSENGTIIDGTDSGQTIRINSGYTVTLTNFTIKRGGIQNRGTLFINNCTLEDNDGAIFNIGTLTINNSIIQKNIASDAGAGIYNYFGIVTLKNCKIQQNIATNDGGAIVNNEGTLTITSSIFTNNTATNGGAIQNNVNPSYTGNLTVTGSIFTNNTATKSYGGALYNTAGSAYVTSNTFKNNNAKSDGGAIYNGDTLVVNKSTFTSNNATNGGAIQNTGTTTINNCSFTINNATNGGAILNYITLNVTDSTFTDNSATNGGAIYNYDTGTLNVTSSTLTNNKATNGGFMENYGTTNVHFNRIVGNIATIGSAIRNGMGTVDASFNWWGSNSNPSGKIYGTVTSTPWLVLTITTNPTSIPNNGYSIITADLIHDNNGKRQTTGNVPDGISVLYSTTLGTIITPLSTIYGVSQAILHSGTVPGTAYVYAKLDNQTIHTSVKILDTIPPKVSLTSPKNGSTGSFKNLYYSH